MDKLTVIRALQTGLVQAIDVIEFLKKDRAKDENIEHVLENLQQLLKYADHVYEKSSSNNHPLYSN